MICAADDCGAYADRRVVFAPIEGRRQPLLWVCAVHGRAAVRIYGDTCLVMG